MAATTEQRELQPALEAGDVRVGVVRVRIRVVLLGEPPGVRIAEEHPAIEFHGAAFGVVIAVEEEALARAPHGLGLLAEHQVTALHEFPVGVCQVDGDRLEHRAGGNTSNQDFLHGSSLRT